MVQVSGGQLITSSGQPIMVQAMSGGQGQTIMQVPVSGAQGLQQVRDEDQLLDLYLYSNYTTLSCARTQCSLCNSIVRLLVQFSTRSTL